MSNSPKLDSAYNYKGYLPSPSMTRDGLRRTSPRLSRQHPKFIVNGSFNASTPTSNTFSDLAYHKNDNSTGKSSESNRKNSLPEMTSEPSVEVKRVSPKANKETQCYIPVKGDLPREEQFMETVKLNSKLAEELGSAKKEIEVLKGRLKELEMNQLARDCTAQLYSSSGGGGGSAQDGGPAETSGCPGLQDDCSVIAPESANKAACFRVRATKHHRGNPQTKAHAVPHHVNVRPSLVCAEPLYGCKCTACEAAMGGDLHAALSATLNVDLHKFPISSNVLVQLGDHVVIKGERTGRIRYIGHLDKIGQPNLVFVGLELDAPVGSHDGFFNKKRYFFCQRDHGTFIPLHDVICKVKPDAHPEDAQLDLRPSSASDALLATLGVGGMDSSGHRTLGANRLKSKSTEDFIALVGMTSRTRSPHWLQSEVLAQLEEPPYPRPRSGRRSTACTSGEDLV